MSVGNCKDASAVFELADRITVLIGFGRVTNQYTLPCPLTYLQLHLKGLSFLLFSLDMLGLRFLFLFSGPF
jgi:hypothetical protein